MKTLQQNVKAFVQAKMGKYAYGVFTGYSNRAFNGYIYLIDAWLNADLDNRAELEVAMCAILRTLQETELPIAKWAIAGVGDYGYIDELWPIISPEPMYASERDRGKQENVRNFY